MTYMNKKILYILAGANGSGKSTIAKELLQEHKLEYVNADDIAKELNPINISKVKISAGKETKKRIESCFKEKLSFAVETTLSGNNYINTFKTAKELKYRIILLYTFVDNSKTCIERIKVRVKNGGHPVPDEDVIRRYKRSISNFWNKYKSLADEWLLYYNGNENYVFVAQQAKGKDIEIINENLYTLFRKNL